ncbi:endonuclease/exonuclease/phosphatase family protein [Nafulsella turpanensis]|uniref:endonuclease/exonuclease/phosphatase family protein n=1 Tax=Nafulsella turpanensis TaxID=1265690 RepID=UPI000347BB6B|nr:endonuclease/exonuclease/phosphatase family protein [Nafulsella turpanensis]
MDYFQTALYILGSLFIIFTLIPFVRSDYWTFRVFEFPRAQKLVIVFFILLAFIWYTGLNSGMQQLFSILLLLNLLYLVYQVFPFTPLAPKQMLSATKKGTGEDFLSIMVANVYQYNRRADKCLHRIKKHAPDVVLLVETDQWWKEAVNELEETYPHRVLHPIENTYGMMLYSRLPLEGAQVEYLIKEHIPSIHTRLILPSGEKVQLYCIHPEPPAPQENVRATERNAEILTVGKMAKACKLPVVVCGDLNDVAWSHTTKLFLKTSGLLDPRRGRGFYNSFHAKLPLMRWPLDHFFCSREFRLIQLKRLEPIGSDHFPMFIRLSLEPQAKDEQEVMHTSPEEKEEVEEKIEKAEESKSH